MFTHLGRFVVRRRRLILALTALFVVAAAVVGTNVFDRLGRRGFDDPGSESYNARKFLEDELRAGDPDVVLLVDAWRRRRRRSRGRRRRYRPDGRGGRRGVRRLRGLVLVARPGSRVAQRRRVGGARPDRPRGHRPRRRRRGCRDHRGVRRCPGSDRGRGGRTRGGRHGHHRTGPVRPRARGGDRRSPRPSCSSCSSSAASSPPALPMAVALVALIGTFLALFLIALVTDVSDLLHQPHDRARTRPRHRLLPLHRQPVPRGAARRSVERRRDRAHDGDRGQDGRVLGAHGRRLARRAARVPAVLPPVVRVRGSRRWSSSPRRARC